MKSSSSYLSQVTSRFFSSLALLGALGILIYLTACGGSSTPPLPTPTPGSTAVQINLGDAPADWMLAFSMNVTSMALNGSSGSVSISNAATPVEMIHRLGTMEPVALIAAPQGSYTGATITVASCKVTYLDPTTKALVQKTINGPISATIPFASSVTLGTTPLAFNFDLDLENSVTMDSSGNLQFSPQFHTSTATQGSGNGNDARYGGMQQMMGVVSSTSTNAFTIIPLQATNTFTFTINNATQFQGNISTMAMLGTGMGVLVTATLQPDGTFLATRVRSRMNAGGIMGGGIITAVTGKPATQLTLVMQNGAGASITTDYLSQTVTVDIASTTGFEIDDDRIDLTHLPFTPLFDANNIYVGQSVLPISESALAVSGTTSTGTIAASEIRLQEQGARGTTDVAITPATASTFTLTLMPGCAFTTLTGATSILVYQQTGTNVENSTTIPAGTTLRVHGLLFNNAGQWTLVASTIASS